MTRSQKTAKHNSQFLILIWLLVMVCSLVIFPNESVSAAKEGLSVGYGVILPSLFPFFVISSLLIKTGAADNLENVFAPAFQRLFKTGSCGASAFIIGLLGGYPLGAKTVVSMYENGSCSKAEAEHLLGFCSNSGPAFILGACGAGIFQSTSVGLILLIAHILSAIIVGIFFSFKSPPFSSVHASKAVDESFPTIFVNSVRDSFRSILDICGFVVFFAVLIEFTPLPKGNIGIIMQGLIELTAGVFRLTDLDFPASLPLCSLFLGWGGLCVHCQVLSLALPQKLKTVKYFTGKLLHGILSAFITFCIIILY